MRKRDLRARPRHSLRVWSGGPSWVLWIQRQMEPLPCGHEQSRGWKSQTMSGRAHRERMMRGFRSDKGGKAFRDQPGPSSPGQCGFSWSPTGGGMVGRVAEEVGRGQVTEVVGTLDWTHQAGHSHPLFVTSTRTPPDTHACHSLLGVSKREVGNEARHENPF